MKKENENALDKISRFSFISAIVGVCTIGICPIFGVIGIVAPLVMKSKGADLSDDSEFRNKKALIAGIASLVMFAADLVLIVWLQSKYGLFK